MKDKSELGKGELFSKLCFFCRELKGCYHDVGESMKRYIQIILTVCCFLIFTACGSNQKIILPKAEELRTVEIGKNDSAQVKTIRDSDEIAKLIREITEHSTGTRKESINDQPTNIEHYLILKFVPKNVDANPSVAYVYREKGNGYIEQPYSGIWKLDDSAFAHMGDDFFEG